MKPIMTNLGLFDAQGRTWLVSDGTFPFDHCDDRTTSAAKRQRVIELWEKRLGRYQAANTRRQRAGMTWAQYYQADR